MANTSLCSKFLKALHCRNDQFTPYSVVVSYYCSHSCPEVDWQNDEAANLHYQPLRPPQTTHSQTTVNGGGRSTSFHEVQILLVKYCFNESESCPVKNLLKYFINQILQYFNLSIWSKKCVLKECLWIITWNMKHMNIQYCTSDVMNIFDLSLFGSAGLTFADIDEQRTEKQELYWDTISQLETGVYLDIVHLLPLTGHCHQHQVTLILNTPGG